MTTTISIPGLDQALGGSVIYDEYKGDLAQAERQAEQQLAVARQQPDPAALADALLARAVVHLLQGQPGLARRCCDEIQQVAAADPPRQFRAAVYASLAAYQHLNEMPGDIAANGSEFNLRQAEFLAALVGPSQLRSQLQPQIAAPALQLEHALIADFQPTLLLARSFVAGTAQVSAELDARLLSMALDAAPDFRKQIAALEVGPAMRAYADLQDADLHYRVGQQQQAEQLLDQAIAGYTSAGDLAGAAACHMRRGDWRAAPFSTPLTLNLAMQSGTVEGSQLSTTLEAREFGHDRADLAAAQAAYAQAGRLFRQAHAPRGQAALWLRRSYLAWLAGDARDALAAARQAETQLSACGDRRGVWLARTQVVLLRIAAGELPEDQAAARAIGAWGAGAGSFSYVLGLGVLCSRMGRHWLLRRGDYERALACFRLAAVLNQALGAATHHAQNIVDQGAVLQSIGERAGALTLYEQAIERYLALLADESPLTENLRQRVMMLGTDLYRLYDQARNADGLERSAARLRQQIDAVGGGRGGFFELAAAMIKGSAQDSALAHTETLVIASAAHELIQAADVLVPAYRARAARDRGDSAETQRQFGLAEAALQQVADGQREFLRGIVLAHQRRYPEAAAVFRRYFATDQSGRGLAEALTQWGPQSAAEAQLQARRQLERAAAVFVRVKAYTEARAQLDALERLAGAEWWSDQERPWETLSDYGEMYEGLGQLSGALAAYDRAIELLEQRRQQLSRDELKTALAAGSGPQYLYFYAARTAQKLQSRLFQAGDRAQAQTMVARAFGYAERGKARALLDLLAGSAALAGVAASESVALRAWRELTARLTLWRGLLAREHGQQQPDAERIAALSQQIADGEAELYQTEQTLARSDPDFYRLIDPRVQPLTVEAISALLAQMAGPATALISYFFLEEQLLIWAITAQGMALAYLGSQDSKALERDLRAFHRACEQRQPLDQLGARLSAALLDPLAEVLRAHSQLIIVPHGVAHTLPFQALPWQGQPLAASHTIRYLPNASALQFLGRAASSDPQRLLAVGNPARMSFQSPLDAARVSAPELPAAEAEATYVAALFPDSTLLLGAQASAQAVRAQIDQYTLLHFATHGYLSEDAPLLSAILLADGAALSVYEIMSLRLRADLVVLSACRTALGETTGGDDVLGLTRGLLGAGARAALVSLWPVADVSTSLLMGFFYRRLRAGLAPAAALQAAQNELRQLSADQATRHLTQLRQSPGLADPQLPPAERVRDFAIPGLDPLEHAPDYSHPFYWAPFIVVGG